MKGYIQGDGGVLWWYGYTCYTYCRPTGGGYMWQPGILTPAAAPLFGSDPPEQKRQLMADRGA